MCALRILIVDDREFVRKVFVGIRRLLSARIDLLVCGEAEDGIQAVERAKSQRPPRLGDPESRDVSKRG